MNNNEEKCCGSCAFMICEDTYGYGSCPFDSGELKYCGMNACQNYIGRDDVRHSAAILAQFKRCVYNGELRPQPETHEIDDAIGIITRYVNVITKKL